MEDEYFTNNYDVYHTAFSKTKLDGHEFKLKGIITARDLKAKTKKG